MGALIKHNVSAVLGRLKFFEAKVPSVVTGVMGNGKLWDGVATRAAERTLLGLARTEAERRMAPLFAATVTVEVFAAGSEGFNLSMREPGEMGGVVARSIAAVEATGTRVYNGVKRKRRERLPLGASDAATVRAVRDGILGWVQDEKRLEMWTGGRDHGLTYEAIAERIGWILFDPTPSDIQSDAAQDLAPHIQAYMTKRAREAAGLDGQTVELWLRAVLTAWRLLIAEQLPAKVRQDLRKVAKGLRTELPI